MINSHLSNLSEHKLMTFYGFMFIFRVLTNENKFSEKICRAENQELRFPKDVNENLRERFPNPKIQFFPKYLMTLCVKII